MDNNASMQAARKPGELIEAIAARQDRSAFVALFQYYAPRIKTLVMRMGMSPDSAEDIAQETLIRVWRKAGYYDARQASASAWVFTIARNIRIDRLRHGTLAQCHVMYEEIAQNEPERPDAVLALIEREQHVRAALGDLPKDQKRVVELSFFEGRPHEDISRLLEIPLGTVKSRLRLAMKRLRDLLGDQT